ARMPSRSPGNCGRQAKPARAFIFWTGAPRLSQNNTAARATGRKKSPALGRAFCELRCRSEGVAGADSCQPGTARCGFVEAAVGVADDDRTDVLAVEQVVEADEAAQLDLAVLAIDADAQVGERIAGGRVLGVGVFDIDLAAGNAFDRGMEAGRRMLPGEFAEHRLRRDAGQAVAGGDGGPRRGREAVVVTR